MLLSEQSFSFPSLKRPRTLVLLTAVFWELSPAGRCCTSCGRERAEARWSWEKHTVCLFVFSQLCSLFAGQNPLLFRDEMGCDVFRGSLEESEVVG